MSDKGTRILAIDFGTTNSYFALCPSDEIAPQGVDFEGTGRDGLSTAVLYKDGKTFLVGDKAVEEYFDSLPDEKKTLSLMMQFKPDISKSEKARNGAIDFLSAVADILRKSGILLFPEDVRVLFGVPSDADEEYRNALKQVAKQAGYGEIELLDEPIGALIHHIAHKEIPASAVFSPGLIVDFGGGTCDFAIIDNGEIKESWGDFWLGGRLFDDLFFQWFADQRPSALGELRENHDEMFFLLSRCKELKEHFSRTMERDKTEIVHKMMYIYGRIDGLTWEDFLNRARNYRPSDTLLDIWLSGGVVPPEEFKSGKPIDLIERFRCKLRDGLQKSGIDKNSLRYVILTGGSSQWPFVKDIVREEFASTNIPVVRSTRPYVAIAMGLSILPAVKRKFRNTKQKIQNDKGDFLKNEIEPYLVDHLDRFADLVAEEIVSEVFDKKVQPVMLEFRESEIGDSLKELESRIAEQAEACRFTIDQIIREKANLFSDKAVEDIINKTRSWLESYRLTVRDEKMARDQTVEEDLASFSMSVPGKEYFAAGTFMTTIISGVVTSMLCGGQGVALITGGLPGLVLGAILGGAVGLILGVKGKEIRVPGPVRKQLLRDKVILNVRKKFHKKVKKEIKKHLEKGRIQLKEHLEKIVDREIRALSEISQIGPI